MPLLKVEADKISNDSLQKGVVEVIIERGARDLLMYLPFKGFEGRAYAFNLEKTLPTGSSARDPYGTTALPTGVGTRERISVETAMLSRNADTAKIDVIGKSDVNDARYHDTVLAAKKLAADFMEQFISGKGARWNMKGLEYWLDYFPTVNSDYGDLLVYNTNTGLSSGTKQALALTDLDDLLSRYKGERFQLIVSDRATYVAYRNLLIAAGGNIASMFMKNNFGENVPAYDGIPWLILDPAGQAKAGADADYDHTGGASERLMTVDTTSDPYWIGFSSLDVGRTVTFSDASTGVIETVVDESKVTFTSGTNPGSDKSALSFTVSATNVIYALRFDEQDGITSIYHANEGGSSAPTGDYYGPIGGFDAEDLHILEDLNNYRTRLSWFGNIVNHQPWSCARLSHYTI